MYLEKRKEIIMKKEVNFKKLFVVVLAFIAIGCISCEKLKKDYREKWVGSYECEEESHWWRLISLPEPPYMSDTSGMEIFQTTVIVTAIGDSSLKFVENRRGKSYEERVNADGYFFKSIGYFGGIKGNFINDSLYMVIASGMQGWRDNSTYKGKKN